MGAIRSVSLSAVLEVDTHFSFSRSLSPCSPSQSIHIGEDRIEDVGIQGALEGVGTSPYVTGDFQIMSLGKIVKDPEYFRDERFNWPEVYAVRKFTSISVRRFIL